MRLTRREAFIGAVLTVSMSGLQVLAQSKNDSAELINKFTGGVKPVEGKVKLDVPEIAENGNTVPITVSVDSPMTAASHVKEILLVCDGNPRGGVATFKFAPDISVPEANIRMRLAETQNVIAVAKMSDGTYVMAAKQIKVTIGGCGG
jgi:sulfur-oxidizing protein SoxY